MTSIQVSLGTSVADTSQLTVANVYAFQADWLGRTVDTTIRANDINYFECTESSWCHSVFDDHNAISGNNLPTGTSLPLKLLGDFDGYKSYVFQEVLNNAVTYCQTLLPKCIFTADAVGAGRTVAIQQWLHGLQQLQHVRRAVENSWPATYGANVEGTICSATFNCGIGRGNTANNYALSYANPYIGGGIIGWGCG